MLSAAKLVVLATAGGLQDREAPGVVAVDSRQRQVCVVRIIVRLEWSGLDHNGSEDAVFQCEVQVDDAVRCDG